MVARSIHDRMLVPGGPAVERGGRHHPERLRGRDDRLTGHSCRVGGVDECLAGFGFGRMMLSIALDCRTGWQGMGREARRECWVMASFKQISEMAITNRMIADWFNN